MLLQAFVRLGKRKVAKIVSSACCGRTKLTVRGRSCGVFNRVCVGLHVYSVQQRSLLSKNQKTPNNKKPLYHYHSMIRIIFAALLYCSRFSAVFAMDGDLSEDSSPALSSRAPGPLAAGGAAARRGARPYSGPNPVFPGTGRSGGGFGAPQRSSGSDGPPFLGDPTNPLLPRNPSLCHCPPCGPLSKRRCWHGDQCSDRHDMGHCVNYWHPGGDAATPSGSSAPLPSAGGGGGGAGLLSSGNPPVGGLFGGGDPTGKKPCRYGADCYDNDPAHLAQFEHPEPCQYGASCWNQDPTHRRTHSHPCRYGDGCFDKYETDHRRMFSHNVSGSAAAGGTVPTLSSRGAGPAGVPAAVLHQLTPCWFGRSCHAIFDPLHCARFSHTCPIGGGSRSAGVSTYSSPLSSAGAPLLSSAAAASFSASVAGDISGAAAKSSTPHGVRLPHGAILPRSPTPYVASPPSSGGQTGTSGSGYLYPSPPSSLSPTLCPHGAECLDRNVFPHAAQFFHPLKRECRWGSGCEKKDSDPSHAAAFSHPTEAEELAADYPNLAIVLSRLTPLCDKGAAAASGDHSPMGFDTTDNFVNYMSFWPKDSFHQFRFRPQQFLQFIS